MPRTPKRRGRPRPKGESRPRPGSAQGPLRNAGLGSPSAGAGAWPVAHFSGCIFLASCGSGPPPPPKPPPEAPMVTDPLAKILASMDPGSHRSLPVPTRRDDLVEKIFGHAVADPYRWLEDGDSDEVKRWTDEQNALTRRVLDRIAVAITCTSASPSCCASAPSARRRCARCRPGHQRYFHTKREGDQNQPMLYVRDGVDGRTRFSSIPTRSPRTARPRSTGGPRPTTASCSRSGSRRTATKRARSTCATSTRKRICRQDRAMPLRVDRVAARRQELLLLALPHEGNGPGRRRELPPHDLTSTSRRQSGATTPTSSAEIAR